MQEIVLGVGGWRLVEALHPEIEVCHLNEGHAAFAVIERARRLVRRLGLVVSGRRCGRRAPAMSSPPTRRWLPGSTAFARICSQIYARYLAELARKSASAGGDSGARPRRSERRVRAVQHGLSGDARVGRAASASAACTARVSRRIFQPLFPRWPEARCRSATSPTACTSRLGFRRGRPIVDRGLRQGALARHAGKLTERSSRSWPTRRSGRCAATAGERLVDNVRERLCAGSLPRAACRPKSWRRPTCWIPTSSPSASRRRFTDYKRPNLLLARPGPAGVVC